MEDNPKLSDPYWEKVKADEKKYGFAEQYPGHYEQFEQDERDEKNRKANVNKGRRSYDN